MSLKSFLKIKLLCFGFLFVLGARAQSEMNAKVRDNYTLKESPSWESSPSAVTVSVDETVYVLGTSVDGLWAQVMKRSGQKGWIALNQIDLFRVNRHDDDEYYYVLMRERRHTTRWVWNTGLSYGPTPMGLGAETTLNLNLFKRGAFDMNSDQLEVGTGFRYHLGADPAPALRLDGSLYNKPAKAFWEIPVYVQWLVRLGFRGEWMFGPRLGFSVIRDSYNRFDVALPGLTGFELRHYPADDLGFSWNVWVQARSVIYYQTSFALSYRF